MDWLYFLTLEREPSLPQRGWVAGRLNDRKANDLILSLTNSVQTGIKQQHAVFQYRAERGRIYVKSVRDQGIVKVNGLQLPAQEMRVLNDPSASLTVGELEYEVKYERFAYTKDYYRQRNDYIRRIFNNIGTHDLIDNISLTPTPSLRTNHRIRGWTFTDAGTIGSGAGGRVSAAMNNLGKIVALKRASVGKKSKTLEKRIQTLQRLTFLSELHKENRILRLIEVITDDISGNNPSADVWFVLDPLVGKTLEDYRAECSLSASHG